MNKKLVLEFNTQGNRTLQISLENPQENLTAETIQSYAENIIPVLQTSSGLSVLSLKSAEYTTTTVEKVV
jgi:hypothetical protein